MADFNALQAVINAYIKKNGVQAITGQILNGVLTGMVNALGKGFTVAGEASPSTDPGLMTGPVAYIAHTAGTYTNFDNIAVDQGEVAMLIFNENAWSKNVLASLAAVATIDDQVGTPAVTTSFVDGVLTFDFRNMKGDPGLNGDPAGFGTVNATVDSNIGTPGVSVVTSGPDTAKNMTFQFTNLKGETGVTSVVVTVDNTSGNPACAVSLNGQELHLDFTGLKGAQGNPGSSVDYPFTLVNNLTTNDPDQALSAAMGVQLEAEVSQLEAKTNKLLDTDEEFDITNINLASLTYWDYTFSSDDQYGTSTSYKHTRIGVEEGDVVKITANNANGTSAYLLAEPSRPTSGATITKVPGTTKISIRASETAYITIPSGCCAIAIYAGKTSDNYPYLPSAISIYKSKASGTDEELKDITSVPVFKCEGYKPQTSNTITTGTFHTIIFPCKTGRRYRVSITFASMGNSIFVGQIASLPIANLAQSFGDTEAIENTSVIYSYTPQSDGYLILGSVGTMNAYSVSWGEISVLGTSQYDTIGRKITKFDQNTEDVSNLLKTALHYDEVDLTLLTKRNYYIKRTNIYGADSSLKHILVPVSEGGYVLIKTQSSIHAQVAWLTSDAAPVANGVPAFVSGTDAFSLKQNGTYLLRIPSGANYMYVFSNNASDSYLPDYLGIAYPASGDEPQSANVGDAQVQTLRNRIVSRGTTLGLWRANVQVDADGWEIPQTVQHLNATKKALQLRNLTWTPLADVPGKHSDHLANVTQTYGVPYSGNWHHFKYVGCEVSIHTFMTAVHNPYSLLYTENVSAANSKSAWGLTYYNTNGFAYYGTVCCGFSSCCAGLPFKYGNGKPKKIARYTGLFVPLYPQSVDALQIGDIADGATHSMIVIGLHRDADGNIDKVKVAESTSAVEGCRTVTYTASGFISATIGRVNGPMTLFRNAELYKNVDYVPSSYVALTDYGETPQVVTYNDEICCFAGDKAAFMEGDIVAVNYNLTASPAYTWTHIEVYKDDVLFNTYALADIDQSALDISQKNHALPFGTSLSAGKYKARMTDGEHFSDYTYWEVLANSVTITEIGGGGYKVKYNGTGGIVMVIAGRMSEQNTYFISAAYRNPDWAEAEDNEVVLYYDDLLSYFGLEPSLYDKLRVVIKGDYGHAATPALSMPGRNGADGDGGDDDDETPDA